MSAPKHIVALKTGHETYEEIEVFTEEDGDDFADLARRRARRESLGGHTVEVWINRGSDDTVSRIYIDGEDATP